MARTAALLKAAEVALAKDLKKALPSLIEAWCLAPAPEQRALVTLLEQVVSAPSWSGRREHATQAPVAFSPDGKQVVVGCAEPEVFQVHG